MDTRNGRTIWEARDARTADDRLIEQWTRRETEAQRRARIARKQVDPAAAAALRRLWAAA